MADSMVREAERALRLGQTARPPDYHVRGKVMAVKDGAYQVRLSAAENLTACSRYCDAKVGDTVLVLVMSSGKCAAIAKLIK